MMPNTFDRNRSKDRLFTQRAEYQTIVIDATYLKAHRTACGLRLSGKRGIWAPDRTGQGA